MFLKLVRNKRFVISGLHIMYLSIYLNTFYKKKNCFSTLLTVVSAQNASVVNAKVQGKKFYKTLQVYISYIKCLAR